MKPRDLLIRWRKAAGLTQAEAAELLGYASHQSISNKEKGRHPISNRELKLIRSHALANGIDLPETTKETEPTE